MFKTILVGYLQVLERDLAIFGFFIALGRRTQSYLDANNTDMLDESLESFLRYASWLCFLLMDWTCTTKHVTYLMNLFIFCFLRNMILLCRYLVGGSVLFYPQLASVSTYQIFVEVSFIYAELLPNLTLSKHYKNARYFWKLNRLCGWKSMVLHAL